MARAVNVELTPTYEAAAGELVVEAGRATGSSEGSWTSPRQGSRLKPPMSSS